jgi:hypothetical protein
MMPFFAPKGQKNLAQGFNPGLTGPTACALKVALEGFVSPDARGLPVYASFPIWCRFPPSLANAELRRTGRAHGVKTLTSGLKPWAKFCCPFGAGLRPIYWCARPAVPDFSPIVEYLKAYGERLTVNY